MDTHTYTHVHVYTSTRIHTLIHTHTHVQDNFPTNQVLNNFEDDVRMVSERHFVSSFQYNLSNYFRRFGRRPPT